MAIPSTTDLRRAPGRSSVTSISRNLRPDVGPALPFSCGWTHVGTGFACVHLTGELHRDTSPQLVQTLGDAQLHASVVVVDLRELNFVDRTGMRAIADAHERARLQGDQLAVVRAAAHVDRLFALTGICDAVEVVDLSPSEPPIQALLSIRDEGGSR